MEMPSKLTVLTVSEAPAYEEDLDLVLDSAQTSWRRDLIAAVRQWRELPVVAIKKWNNARLAAKRASR